MTTHKPMSLEPQSKWLRKLAEEIRAEGHAGWSNTCEQAADANYAHLSASKEAVAWRFRIKCKGPGAPWAITQDRPKVISDKVEVAPLFTHPASSADDRTYETGFAEGMAKAAELLEGERKEAERYRWLRMHCRFTNDSMRELWFDPHNLCASDAEPEELDKEIDICIAEQEKIHD